MAILVKAPTPEQAPKIPNRIALIDADVVAYYSSFGLDDAPKTAAETKCWQRCNQVEQETQATHFRYFLSGSYQDNFRTGIARLKRYKGDRYDSNFNRLKEQPKWLQHVREWLKSTKGASTSCKNEADDTISIAAAKIRRDGNYEACISTVDKDLGINPCVFHDQMHNTLMTIEPFGTIYMDDKGKLRGNGIKFFYAQLLMGDPTDWIPGLPKVSEYQVENYGVRRGFCGPKAAFLTLDTAKTEKELIERVSACYEDYWKDKKWSDWREPEKELKADWFEMLVEQGRLLWMQRHEGDMWLPEERMQD